MARKDRDLLNELVKFPWRVNVILAAVIYVGLSWIVPGFLSDRPLLKSLASFTQSLAPVAAFAVLLVSAVSALYQFRKGKLLERQTGPDIDGPKLTQMIASIRQSGGLQVQPGVLRACPKCGSEMVLRVEKKGPHSGKKFWGCSKFPNCSGVASAEN